MIEDKIITIKRHIDKMSTTENLGELNYLFEKIGQEIIDIFDERYRLIASTSQARKESGNEDCICSR